MFEYSWHLSALYHLVWPCNYKDKEFVMLGCVLEESLPWPNANWICTNSGPILSDPLKYNPCGSKAI